MKKPQTLRTHLLVAVCRAVFITCMVGGVALVMQSLPQVAEVIQDNTPTAPVERPNAKGSPVWFVEKFDCWTGEPPADMRGKVPGHVIVTEAGRTFRGGPAKVDTALRHIFEGEPTEIESIHAFCR